MKISQERHQESLQALLFYFAYKSSECNDYKGTEYNPKQVMDIFNIKKSTLYNWIDKLEKKGLIKTNDSYSVKRFSRRVKVIKFNYDNPEYIQFCHEFKFLDKKSKFNFEDGMNRKYYTSYHERVKESNYFIEHDTVQARYIDFIDAYLYRIVEYINLHSHPDFNLIYNLRFLRYDIKRWGKMRPVEEFKGRVFNLACLTKSGKEGKVYKKEDKRSFRTDFLKERGMDDYEEIFDIKSQIPRLTGFLNGTIEWESEDVYVQIKKRANVDLIRDNIKSQFMPLYFGKRTLRQLYAGDKRKKNWIDKSKILSFEDYKKIYHATNEIIGKSFGNYIFVATSIIEILTLYRLIKTGHKVFNVYDGFYSNEQIADLINKTVSEVAEEFKISPLNYLNFKKLTDGSTIDYFIQFTSYTKKELEIKTATVKIAA